MERSPLSNLPPPPRDACADFELRFRGADLPEEPADPAAFARPYTIADAEDPGSSQLLLESAALAEGLLPVFGAPRGERLVPIFDGDLRPIPIPEPELPQAAQEQPAEPTPGGPALTSRASPRARPSPLSTRP